MSYTFHEGPLILCGNKRTESHAIRTIQSMSQTRFLLLQIDQLNQPSFKTKVTMRIIAKIVNTIGETENISKKLINNKQGLVRLIKAWKWNRRKKLAW